MIDNIKEIENLQEKAYILYPYFDNVNNDDLDEIYALVESAGATVVGNSCQKIRQINPATYFGIGKLQEIRETLASSDVNLIVFNGVLSPAQTLNVSNELNGIKVIDRTTLILDIFALNAKTNEGKTQVELAQLKYIYPRLKGKGSALSRLGGGIGTRGPGETQLETDRRHIRLRINVLENHLKELEQRRNIQYEKRNKNNAISVSIVGYTNAGKSTLMNALTNSDLLVEDKLFATLDPTVRKFNLGKYTVLLSDTVGFVKDIPTNLIEAFKSTLESTLKANLLLIVADANSDYENKIQTTLDILDELHITTPHIKILNKCDKISDFSNFSNEYILISAKEKVGLNNLTDKIITELDKYFFSTEIIIPYEKLNEFNSLSKYIESSNIEYLDKSVKVKFCIKKVHVSKFAKFINK